MNWYKSSKLAYKNPWEMTRDEFVQYHHTGNIPDDAYKRSEEVERFSIFEKGKYPKLLDTKQFGSYTVEFRQSGEPLKYVKHDKDDEIMRDGKGEVVYLSDEEMKEKNLATEDQSIMAFVGDSCIGHASNEWGATGVWIGQLPAPKGAGL